MAAIEQGVPYYVYNPAQTDYFALNIPTDPKFVGYVQDITGLDDSGIRENAQVIVAGDGGYHGPFWRDRRPWTISGVIVPMFPLIARDQAQERLEGIVGAAVRSDGLMTWTPADGVQRQLTFRKQQPTRITKGQSAVEKLFQIALVTADWRITSFQQQSVSRFGVSPVTLPTAQNIGNADAAPKFVITGPFSSGGNIVIQNASTGKALVLNSVTIAAGTSWTVDLTGTYPTVIDNNGNPQDGTVDPLQTDWSITVAGTATIGSGNNVFTISGPGSSVASGLTVFWRHSWV